MAKNYVLIPYHITQTVRQHALHENARQEPAFP